MIQPHEITIGTLLRTNEGEIIRVETISSKRQHRKVGYHPKGRPTYMRYVRLAQCELVETQITPELLEANGWEVLYYPHPEFNSKEPDYAYLRKDNWYAEYKFGRNTLNIWLEYDDTYREVLNSDLHIRNCPTADKLAMAFALADIDYKLKIE